MLRVYPCARGTPASETGDSLSLRERTGVRTSRCSPTFTERLATSSHRYRALPSARENRCRTRALTALARVTAAGQVWPPASTRLPTTEASASSASHGENLQDGGTILAPPRRLGDAGCSAWPSPSPSPSGRGDRGAPLRQARSFAPARQSRPRQNVGLASAG